MMTSFALKRHDLAWTSPGGTHQPFVLRADGEEIGWLQFESRSDAKSAAALDGCRWTFERTGAASPAITIRFEGSGELVAKFDSNLTGGGVVSFVAGARYGWAREHIWSTRWCFRCKEQKSTVCVTQQAGPLASGGKVTVCCDAANLAETPILVLLAWYLRILEFERETASIVVCD